MISRHRSILIGKRLLIPGSNRPGFRELFGHLFRDYFARLFRLLFAQAGGVGRIGLRSLLAGSGSLPLADRGSGRMPVERIAMRDVRQMF